jgi:predicted DNA-binding protein with PD1-like motif
MTVTTANARHLLFRLGEDARLPEALLGTLREEVVLAGWMRASGVLHDVRIRTIGGATSSIRTLTGTLHVLTLDGSIGLSQGDVSCGLRAVLAREGDRGLETIAGEIVEARVGGLEVMVTALDDISISRQAGPHGVWLLDPSTATSTPRAPAPVAASPSPQPAAPPPPQPAAPPPPPSPSPSPSPAPDVSRAQDLEPPKPAAPKPSPTFSAGAMPLRPVRPAAREEEEQVYPDAGDVVEHFAFGRCEVVKSDGDRLHLRLGKDGRIKEIALEMLRVTPLPPVDGEAGKHFKLDRKL